MHGADVVYANLTGDMARQARAMVDAMHATGVTRLIFISSMGIYGEVPGERYRAILAPYRDSAEMIEQSDLDYTVLRPGWFTRDPEVRYQITQKGEPFKGHDVSLNGLSELIVQLATVQGLHVRCSLGVSDEWGSMLPRRYRDSLRQVSICFTLAGIRRCASIAASELVRSLASR